MNLNLGADFWGGETTQSGPEEDTSVLMMDANTVATYLQTKFPTPPKPIFIQHWYFYIIIGVCIVSLLGLVGNILTLAAFQKLARPLKPSDYLVSHLAIADICTCFTAPVFNGFYPSTQGFEIIRQNKYVCLSILGMALWSTGLSLFTIVFINIERLLAVVWPLKHMSIVGFKFIKCGIACVWVLNTFLAILPLLGLNTWSPDKLCISVQVHHKMYIWVLVFGVPVLTLVVVSLVSSIMAIVSIRRQTTLKQGRLSSAKQLYKDSQNKITQMLITVIGIFFLTWIPFGVLVFVQAVLYQGSKPPIYIQMLHEAFRLLMGITVVANPIIYATRNTRFHNAYVKLLKFK